MRRIERFLGAAPSVIPRYMRLPHLKEGIERQAEDLLKNGKVQVSTSPFGQNPVLARKRRKMADVCLFQALGQDYCGAEVPDAQNL